MDGLRYTTALPKQTQGSENLIALISHGCWGLALYVCLASIALAQHTSVDTNGLAGKIETDYNAAGKPTEMRTISADGKLQQRVDYEYLPGYYGAQQTDTTYWPNGKVRKVVHHNYDESTNFTGESIQVFDESGQQIGGHKLLHDPWTGVYRCAEWNIAARDYKAVDCPSGDEEGGGNNREVHRFTYDEVMRNLEAARTAAQRNGEIPQPLTREPSVKPEVGFILPARLRAGERVSGTMVENPEQYEGAPDFEVIPISLPLEGSGGASRLSGWQLRIEGAESQAADAPVSFQIPESRSLKLIFRRANDSAQSLTKTLNLPVSSGKPLPSSKSFKADPLCMKGQLCVVHGPFSGDSRKTFVAFESRPAAILAESQSGAYISIPELTSPGGRTLFLAEGSKVAALPVVVGELAISGEGRELKAGDKLIMSVSLDGPGDLPEGAWEGDVVSSDALAQARQLIPGFRLSERSAEKRKAEEEAEHSREKREAQILMILKNANPQQTSVHGSKNDMLVFRLGEEAFERGEFRYSLLVEVERAGKVDIKGYVIPFLGPVAGQEFAVQTASQ